MQLCVLGNLCPETVEESIAMVPSIKSTTTTLKHTKTFSKEWGYDDEAIEKMLNDMSLIKKFELFLCLVSVRISNGYYDSRIWSGTYQTQNM
ncbi:putative HRDC-like superfamily, Rpb4/RPC9 superfamily protein [Helianthus debilis subsp. tardiflorus]